MFIFIVSILGVARKAKIKKIRLDILWVGLLVVRSLDLGKGGSIILVYLA